MKALDECFHTISKFDAMAPFDGAMIFTPKLNIFIFKFKDHHCWHMLVLGLNKHHAFSFSNSKIIIVGIC
jgi:hypothetical protein